MQPIFDLFLRGTQIIAPLCAAYALASMGIEISKPPRRWRTILIVLIVAASVLAFLQWATGYSLAFHSSPAVVYLAGALGYFGSMLLLIPSKVGRKYPNRIVASIGIILPMLTILVGTQDLAIIGLFELSDAILNPLGTGRISSSASYEVIEPLIGSQTNRSYLVYNNPSWLPLIRTQSIMGSVPCTENAREAPTFISIEAGPSTDFADLKCQFKSGPDAHYAVRIR